MASKVPRREGVHVHDAMLDAALSTIVASAFFVRQAGGHYRVGPIISTRQPLHVVQDFGDIGEHNVVVIGGCCKQSGSQI
jgi:hypothetical protein